MLKQILVGGLQDALPTCRLASLQAIGFALRVFSLNVVVATLLPGVATAALDEDRSVSETSMVQLKKIVSRIEEKVQERHSSLPNDGTNLT
ncbi:hypothetical protein CSUI_006785, partial [Cystoisospora suis]